MLVYVAVGWTTALLVIGISVATGATVFSGFDRLSAMSGLSGMAVDAGAIDVARDQYRLYVVTQATMLAAGWFAGAASRGHHEALLHSGCLVALCHVVFVGVGLV
jgi:flagellar protein FlaJ